ncbi:MAG: glycogen debranching enzyme family protein [Phycisphaeraceae bacterium]|nr:glycogen debranching enzyme family protein [Phycisphaeraceae bacterium]
MTLTIASDRASPQFESEGAALRDHGHRREWLLTNGLGGFCMGTLTGLPTRRYHSLLTAPTRAPLGRIRALSAMHESVTIALGTANESTVSLTPIAFASGDGRTRHCPHLRRFEQGHFGCRWSYTISHPSGEIHLERTLHLFDHRNAIAIRYAARTGGVPIRLELRPLVRLGDYHELHAPDSPRDLKLRVLPNGAVVTDHVAGLHLHSLEAAFRRDESWWKALIYDLEAERGLDCIEDLYCPGALDWTTVPAGGTSVMTLFASTDAMPSVSITDDAAARDRRVAEHTRHAIVRAGGDRLASDDQRAIAALVRAADQFVVRRESAHVKGLSVIAGYPWFGDWGRDTFIALPGLMLSTGRYDEALSVLETWSKSQRHGLIPNRFEEQTGEARFNTVDASMWFVRAAGAWEETSGRTAPSWLRRACRAVVDAYTHGTDFGIAMDPADGLIRAGSESTQLTWMDAARDGVVFTPRHGKAVEINALWHHALLVAARMIDDEDPTRAAELRTLAARVAESFMELLWNSGANCLFDRLERDRHGVWQPVDEIRPNQVFALAFEPAILPPDRQRALLATIERELLTPEGLRTLSPSAPNYEARFDGPLFDRDRAYHNGTVWPWLIGAYIDAVLLVRGHKAETISHARRVLESMIERIGDPCVGQLAEVFDADGSPRRPGGCVAQAWSVAETLRALVRTTRASGEAHS